ncbi:DUF72 domain-containing protein [Streptomyces indicus]|uniref:Uncharacterized conserved protein YecE, DUF72 family n=1 Tax=Streptomyces indicus TaxID=417292 RepID=A0A1G8UVB6_9ACTN|nr:DUF72 domain-containing protein [Streptomyces indicus]SDJ57594.1 Uncharacterized conserved protein YecE, DUF72 family [Streptomyces indicus]
MDDPARGIDTAIRVGTCSWTDPALVSSGWYPSGSRDAEGRLRFYATRFPVVESDSAYYALPSARNSRLWVERTPPGFTFDIKAFAPFTGHSVAVRALPADLRPAGPPGRRLRAGDLPADVMDELWRRFDEGIAPLRAAGRLGCVLFQFPPWYAPSAEAPDRILRCAEAIRAPIAVEVRHPGWYAPEPLVSLTDFLARHHIPFVGVDAPGLLPAVRATSPELSVVRFHGRSPHWGHGSKEDRYRHTYERRELEEWVPRIRVLAKESASVHVLFNNCCADASVQAAQAMSELLAA